MSRNDRPARPAQHPMLSYKEFVAERLEQSVDDYAPGEGLSEQVMAPAARVNAPAIDKRLPALMTFQRKEVRMFSDGRVVGLYRELRTGAELVFPQNI